MKPGRRRILAAVLLPAALAVGGLLLAPSPIEPALYEPAPPLPLTGPLAPNEELRAAELLGLGRVRGPEDVAVDAAGRVYGGQEDGTVVRITLGADGSETLETFADTGGRPLGLHFDATGHLWVADAEKGLLSIDPAGGITVHATGAGGVPFGFTDDLDIGPDGTVYFSDASSRWGIDEYLYDLLEARPYGRLMAWHPESGEVEVLLDGLYFANGVAVASGGDFVLVNETYRTRIRRFWLTGPRAGTADVFLDRLPGFPDGVSSNRRGTFWVAMFTVRNALVDRLHRRPWAKGLLAKLPKFLWPKPEPYGLVIALDEQGRPTGSLQDPGGEHLREITSAEEAEGWLYLGTLHGDRIGRVPVPGAG
jgi:sugar lactone lactonase YvrE